MAPRDVTGAMPEARALPPLQLGGQSFRPSGLATFRARRKLWETQSAALTADEKERDPDAAQSSAAPGRRPIVGYASRCRNNDGPGTPGRIQAQEQLQTPPYSHAQLLSELRGQLQPLQKASWSGNGHLRCRRTNA